MVSTTLLLLATGVVYIVVSNVLALQKNIRLARASGIHFIVSPVFFMSTPWLVGHRMLLPLLKKLPRSWTNWVDYTLPDFSYQYRYAVFERIGHDTFLVVAPGGIAMYTCAPAVIAQITTRRNDFPKPTRIYRSLDIYGKNVLTTEKDHWRKHRKATSPPFTEKNNHLVWRESIRQSQAMLTSWVGENGLGDKTVDRVMDDTMRLSLHVISTASFGRDMEWPAEHAKIEKSKAADFVDHTKIKNEAKDIDPGHSMSYTYALHCLLETALLQFLIPRWFLKQVPGVTARKALTAYEEWGGYMKELLSQRKHDLELAGGVTDKNDILTQLVKQQIVESKDGSKGQLNEEEVLGNMFVLILAGHETAANSLHFSILYLALHPESQRRLQMDLEKIFGGKDPQQWDYERDLPSLFGGMTGAVLAEELRLLPPVPAIPKSTMENVGPQKITIDGKDCVVPGDTYIAVSTSAAQRHPSFWPISKTRLPGGKPLHPISNIGNDLEEFRPERWLLSETENTNTSPNGGIPGELLAKGEDGLNVNETEDTSEKLYKPVKGSYLPFSEGYRSCLGRRFAQVEVLATIAVIFQKYSVELDVSKYVNYQDLAEMDDKSKADVWDKAAEDARELLLNSMGVLFTLQIQNGTVPFRFVPRGQEYFPDNVDDIWKRSHPDQVEEKGQPDWRFWYKPSRR